VLKKKVTERGNSKVDVSRIGTSEIIKFHLTTGDDLAQSISEKDIEKIKLRRRISEMEDALGPKSIFVEPPSIISLDRFP